ncbi:MAG: monovalent cation:H+ antiporter, family [Patescibacteria group bacterium]|nr:monovalent cation:H+ antiporter, family [Patescibacteria group bacterium]
MSLEYTLSMFTLLLASVGTYYISRKIKLPYTVLLMLVGSLLVPLSYVGPFSFLREFTLTPELLFYIFLPILIFESAYNMRIRELQHNIWAVSFFSIGSLLISAAFVGLVLWYLLSWFGLEIPMIVVFLFGALISATDPVAVLALFKEYGVPRRLSFLFEGESLFNDGTSLALFLVVLGVATTGFHGAATILSGIVSFSVMVVGGVAFGIFMGFLFAKILEKVEEDEHAEVTITMLVAHLTFILSEAIAHSLSIGGHVVHLSSIIATVMASMVIGNYGRSKISPRVESFLERYWGYFAFLANSLVFISMGLLFANLPIDFRMFAVPVLFAVLVVMIGRALSIYPVAWILNRMKKEEPIPMSWQHLLSWGSLRGALAVTMVLLIPDNFSVAGWAYDFSVKEFLLALTIGCVYFTLFVKATTIGKMIHAFKLDALSSIENAEYRQSRAYAFSHALGKLDGFFEKGYLRDTVHESLKKKYLSGLNQECKACDAVFLDDPMAFERAIRLYAIGMEEYVLKLLFMYREIPDRVFRLLESKLEVQQERIEEGAPQVPEGEDRYIPDWFESITHFIMKIFGMKKREDDIIVERYAYYRAQQVMAQKAAKEVGRLRERSLLESELYIRSIEDVAKAYERFFEDSKRTAEAIFLKHKDMLEIVDASFGERSMEKAYEDGVSELLRKGMISRKIATLLYDETRS